ncbi:hypothetical protein H696_01471 [Fonticula alba]|uniref:C3H1-type domain-containing protein n=1 Tax=Fonticula alba TaxID=691883 RepID=A0A058ZDR0_FONAL|nr:hypothetical protein H696_01471 [Fonticula alba]KCV72063.1 hypothetical protein H696_01471 [Fonticula alba]|eukprot:XP_009493641.1 hypothetical protein H696_01471 [Fonticula alba]
MFSSTYRSEPPPGLRFAFERFQLSNRIWAEPREDGVPPESCREFTDGRCDRHDGCPRRHDAAHVLVCKHYIRGLCKLGAVVCDYVHEYDLSRMPECQFWRKAGTCKSGDECAFRHVAVHPPTDPSALSDGQIRDRDGRVISATAAALAECPHYAQGFCARGPNCSLRHTRKAPCPNFLFGFCPLGPQCPLAHPPFSLDLLSESFRLEVAEAERRVLESIALAEADAQAAAAAAAAAAADDDNSMEAAPAGAQRRPSSPAASPRRPASAGAGADDADAEMAPGDAGPASPPHGPAGDQL